MTKSEYKIIYLIVLHTFLGVITLFSPIDPSQNNGFSIVLWMFTIALPILMLIQPVKRYKYALLLSILDGIFVIGGLILTFAIIELFFVGLFFTFCFGLAFVFERQIIKEIERNQLANKSKPLPSEKNKDSVEI